MNRDCGVETADEVGWCTRSRRTELNSCSAPIQTEIPEKWRAKTLSQVHVDDEAVSTTRGCISLTPAH